MAFTLRMPANRKGIYQELDANGNVIADERWRLLSTTDGGMRIDTETVRIAPYSEPRNESISIALSANAAWRSLAILGLGGRRESRIDFAPGRVNACWRRDDVSRTREYLISTNCEIDYNSPLFNMVTLWRSIIAPGHSLAFDVIFLDSLTFEPRFMRQVYTYLGEEQHETRFGDLPLRHYQLDFGAHGDQISHFWCDSHGVLFDFTASAGGGYKLVAVNFPN